MLIERYNIKLTKNQREVLDYFIKKADLEHSLTIECPVPEIQEAIHFNSNKTAYNIVKQLADKMLITRFADDITLNPIMFTFQKDVQDKKVLNLKFILQELKVEQELFPFLNQENRVKYFQMVSQNRMEASKIDYQLTKDICKLADAGVYEFPLRPLSANTALAVDHCFNVLYYHDIHYGNDDVYEPREIEQCIDYLSNLSLDDIYEYSPFNKENTDYLLAEYVREEADVTE